MPWQTLANPSTGYSPTTSWNDDIDDAAISHMAPFIGPGNALGVVDDIGTVIGSSKDTASSIQTFKSVSVTALWLGDNYGGHPYMGYRDSIWHHVTCGVIFDRGEWMCDRDQPFKVFWSQPPMRGRGRMSVLRRGIR